MRLTVLLLFVHSVVSAQFAGAPGSGNTDAMHKDSSAFVGWATNCTVQRGYLDIADPNQGFASFGSESSALGMADGADVVSLGDSGVAILTFSSPIFDGPGNDFAIFENSFSDNFLELAHVEVSSDGINYARFPSVSNTPVTSQIGPFSATTDPTHLFNLAGKYRANYGTPFDLSQLNGIAIVDVNAVTHIRIVDAVGSIDPNLGTSDSGGNLINDPYPTPFPSSGFDLDAVGVIHQTALGVDEEPKVELSVFPNPLDNNQVLHIYPPLNYNLQLLGIDGKFLMEAQGNQLSLEEYALENQLYILRIQLENEVFFRRIIVK